MIWEAFQEGRQEERKRGKREEKEEKRRKKEVGMMGKKGKLEAKKKFCCKDFEKLFNWAWEGDRWSYIIVHPCKQIDKIKRRQCRKNIKKKEKRVDYQWGGGGNGRINQ